MISLARIILHFLSSSNIHPICFVCGLIMFHYTRELLALISGLDLSWFYLDIVYATVKLEKKTRRVNIKY